MAREKITKRDIKKDTFEEKQKSWDNTLTLDINLFNPKEIDLSKAKYEIDALQNELLMFYLKNDVRFRRAYNTNFTGKFFEFLYDKARLREPIHLSCMCVVRGGKTLNKDEEIVITENNNLKIHPIYEVYRLYKAKKHIKVLCIDRQTFGIEWKELKEAFEFEPERNMIEITTNCGRKIKATKEHSFLLLKKEKFIATKGADLKIGDLLPSAEKLPLHNILDEIDGIKLDFDSGFFFGCWLSDGCLIKRRNGIIITKQDKVFLKKLICSIKNSFKVKVNKYNNKKCKSITFYKKEIKEFIIYNFGQNSKKKIPDWLLMTNENFKKGFISGMLSGDFSINIAKDKNYDISLIQKQKQIIDRISFLLRQFGILTTLRTKKNEQYGDYFILNPISQDIPKISKFFKIFHSKKEIKLKKITLRLEKQKNISTFIKIVPLEREQINKFFKNNGWNKKNSGKRGKRSTLCYYSRKGFISKTTLENQMRTSEKGDTYFEKIINAPIYFERITEIKEIKNKDKVYDLAIEDNENFMLANGLFVHNSYAMISVMAFLNALYKRKAKIDYICANSYEFLEKLQSFDVSMLTNSCFLIDEEKQSVYGIGSIAKKMKLTDVQNIIALENISTISINPTRFANPDAMYGFRAFGKCKTTRTTRFMLYNLQEGSKGGVLPLGMVYIPIFTEVLPYWEDLETDYLLKKKEWVRGEMRGEGDVLEELKMKTAQRFLQDTQFLALKKKNERLTYIALKLGSEWTTKEVESIESIADLLEQGAIRVEEKNEKTDKRRTKKRD